MQASCFIYIGSWKMDLEFFWQIGYIENKKSIPLNSGNLYDGNFIKFCSIPSWILKIFPVLSGK